MTEPLADSEVRALGYAPGPRGWTLIDPEAQPETRTGLCDACRKFSKMAGTDGLCAACLWFGPGDPHGLGRDRLLDEVAGAER